MTERRKHRDLSHMTGSEDTERIRMSKLSQTKSKTNRLSRSLRQTQQSPSSDSSCHFRKDLKTPTRHTRVRLSALNNEDSPSNDSESQLDIIWDPASPTPVWNGKGEKKSSANARVVDISEIVNRIAPKNDRPAVPECSLLQWIGDSALPCTPEVRQPRTRKKSLRQHNVDDLMKLAKQFDFNMFQQQKEHVHEAHNESTNGGMADIKEMSGHGNDLPLSQNELHSTSTGASLRKTKSGKQESTDHKSVDCEMVDDFDALFDGPTQHISGRLSQTPSSHSQEGTSAARTMSSKSACVGYGPCLVNSDPPTVSSAHSHKPDGLSKGTAVNCALDDDWDNDDLLNDSIVFEMTQNPDLFAAPKMSSTQIGQSQKSSDFIKKTSSSVITVNAAAGQDEQVSSSKGINGVFQGKNSKSKNRSTFKLDANPNFHIKETHSGEEPNRCHSSESGKPAQHGGLKGRQPSVCQPDRAVVEVSGYQNPQKTQPVPSSKRESRVQQPVSHQSSSTLSTSCTTRPVPASVSHSTKSTESRCEKEKQTSAAAARSNEAVVSEEDLDSIFASDSLWDDGDDDDLLCQVCDDVEKFSQSQARSTGSANLVSPYVEPNTLKTNPVSATVKGMAPQSSYAAPESSKQGQMAGRMQLKPQCAFSRSNSVPGNNIAFTKGVSQVSSSVAPTAGVPGAVVQNHKVLATNGAPNSAFRPQESSSNWKGQYKFTQLKKSSLIQGAAHGASAGPQYAEKSTAAPSTSSSKGPGTSHQHSFKRHLSDPVALTNKVFVTNQVAGKCSEEEIERKKQEALARRRLRMQMAQKHGGPT
ncbi:hypothetical protein MATL_G00019070 [Megalops atlanticus]|uniref:Ewing's tumor-associated antigen 1 n=1 Tax=Megalops atlanticus TaxID=7932 RepID=A0A9D3QM90_MEGAT|nr:hypothetical protein MATL_G00019070 [Megalops atlanticus]